MLILASILPFGEYPNVRLNHQSYHQFKWCPNRVGSEKKIKKYFFFYKKSEAIFCDPPHAPSGPPCPGGGSARARRRPPPGGPPKKGSPLPRGISRKKVQKRGQNRGKMG